MKAKVLLVFLFCTIAGCATVNPMAVDKGASSVDTRKKSVVLLALDISRSDDSRYVPKPSVVHVEKPGASSKQDRQNFKLREKDKVQLDNPALFMKLTHK